MRMAVLAGFGWTIGFILFVLPDGDEGFKRYLVQIFKYLFILLNATPGLFIFAVYVCNRRVFLLYRQLLNQIYQFLQSNFIQLKEFILNHGDICLNQTKTKLEKLNKNIPKQTQNDIPMNTLTKVKPTVSSSSSNQTTLTHLLTEKHNQSPENSTTYKTLNSSSIEKPSAKTIELNL
jgi:hypothetical protein